MKKNSPWIIALLILIAIFGTMCGTVRQSQRNDADYPQIQIAEDTAYRLSNGDTPASLVGHPVLVDHSLATFIVIYDRTGKVVASSGDLTGTNLPSVPFGVLSSANGKAYRAVTWQPTRDVRIAAVAVATKHYYVLSGRSLYEVERNERKTFELSFLGGTASLIILGFGYAVYTKK